MSVTQGIQRTDLEGWRLKVDDGRQVWYYLSTTRERQLQLQTDTEKYFLGLPFPKPTHPKPTRASEAVNIGFDFLKRLQTEDGHWACEYGGPMFLIPILCVSSYTTGFKIENEVKLELIRYLCNRANKKDGGWGLHIEHHSTIFGTVMNYVALRILGLEPVHPVCEKARKFIYANGGATSIPSWGKLLLACMNMYEYSGMNPIPPELWVLPKWFPFHPENIWIHSRMVYMSMSYLYGVRFKCEINPFIESLRYEIYGQNYTDIQWFYCSNDVHKFDLYHPHTNFAIAANLVLGVYEFVLPCFPYLRQAGIKEAINQIRMENENTNYCGLAPVNMLMNLMCLAHAEGNDSYEFKQLVSHIPDFLFMGKEGMIMSGTNGVQLWDTAFIVQMVTEAKLYKKEENQKVIRMAHQFLDRCQIRSNSKHYGKDYRHMTKGAWPFSTRDQSYVLSDCTAEALKAVLYLQDLDFTENLIDDQRLFDAVNILLSLQNPDGGCASYELVRGSQYYEWGNVSEVFKDIMVEYNYPECTTAVLLGLTNFAKFFPDHRPNEIKRKQSNILSRLNERTGPESLATFGEFYDNSETVKRACDYLVGKQQQDGGWGETFKSCELGVYTQAPTSQAVNTSWVLLSLLAAKYPDRKVIERGIKVVIDRQLPSGEWEQELIEGVFNKNCMISYPNYKLYFTIWALARFANVYEDPEI